LKRRGSAHTFAEKLLMKQVAEEFTKKLKDPGAKEAADQLGVSRASFYNYAHGTDLPRVEVLRAAHKKWGIEWNLIDTSALFRAAKPISAEQLVLPLIRSVREEDVEVIEVATASDSSLRVMLKIRFATQSPTRNQVSTKR
jgi:transcriptional regulator with XRE-family HTH domain